MLAPVLSIHGLIPSQGGLTRLFDQLNLKVPQCQLSLDHVKYTRDMADVFWYVWVDFSQRSCSSAEISRAARPVQPSSNTGSDSARHHNGPPCSLHSALSAKIMGQTTENQQLWTQLLKTKRIKTTSSCGHIEGILVARFPNPSLSCLWLPRWEHPCCGLLGVFSPILKWLTCDHKHFLHWDHQGGCVWMCHTDDENVQVSVSDCNDSYLIFFFFFFLFLSISLQFSKVNPIGRDGGASV